MIPPYQTLSQLPREKLESVIGAYNRVFGTVDGQMVLEDLKCRHCDRLSYGGDVNDTIFREGQRHLAMEIISLASNPPEAIMELLGFRKIEGDNDNADTTSD